MARPKHSHLVWRPGDKKTKQREIWRKESPVFAAAEAERLAAQKKTDDDLIRAITGCSAIELRNEICSTSLKTVAARLKVTAGPLRRFCEAFGISRAVRPSVKRQKMRGGR